MASPSVAYGCSSPVVMNNNFELIKTIIPKLNIFEQLQILSLLASSIEKMVVQMVWAILVCTMKSIYLIQEKLLVINRKR